MDLHYSLTWNCSPCVIMNDLDPNMWFKDMETYHCILLKMPVKRIEQDNTYHDRYLNIQINSDVSSVKLQSRRYSLVRPRNSNIFQRNNCNYGLVLCRWSLNLKIGQRNWSPAILNISVPHCIILNRSLIQIVSIIHATVSFLISDVKLF